MGVKIDMTGQRFGRLLITATFRRGGRSWAAWNCECGKTGESDAYTVRKGLATSCGCAVITPLAERFWAKVDKNGPTMPGMESPCWIWIAAKATKRGGYGVISGPRAAGAQKAHRVAFVLQGGVLTQDKPDVLHRCDNPPCVRGDHLFAGNDADNVADMISKGRDQWSRSREAAQ